MNAQELKSYIHDNDLIEQVLEALGCHHIRRHSNEYLTCANPDGNNPNAVVIYLNENLTTINYTRQLTNNPRTTDIFDLVAFYRQCMFPEALKDVCGILGLDYYSEPVELPESLQILAFLEDMRLDKDADERGVLKPIDEQILSYYLPYGNTMFYNDGISYEVQKEFNIGYCTRSNRITIPLRDSLGTLCGVKGRYFGEPDEYHPKYLYLEKCSKSMMLYGYYENREFIKDSKAIFCFEAEKAVLQAASYGYRNAVALGGKTISKTQMELLVRCGVQRICLALDKDVSVDELKHIVSVFPEGIPVYAVIDKEQILDEKQSPSDDINKWVYLIKNHIYRIK